MKYTQAKVFNKIRIQGK